MSEELDREIAEIFGTPFRVPAHGSCCTCQVCGWGYDECQCGYSTDIEKAWEIVEKLAPLVGDFKNADGFFILKYGEFADHGESEDGIPSCVDESEEADNKDTAPWSAHFHLGLIAEGSCPEHWGHGDCFCARGATAAEAICRAALLAMRKV